MQNLEKYLSNKNNSTAGILIPVFLISLFLFSCNPTKYVPQGESLLDENHINVNKEGINKSDLAPYIRQKPNKRIFGAKFHLGLFNLSNINKSKWPHNWLREIGEEPVVFDPYSTYKSTGQIKSYVASKGYFDSNVLETIETANRKTKVFYNIDLKEPYKIRHISYEIADSNIKLLFDFDSVNCLIRRGEPYDVDVLQAEMKRVERDIKDFGFYNFSSDFISFNVDSTIGKRQVDIYYNIRKFLKVDNKNEQVQVPHQVYRVNKVFIFPDFVPKDALEGGESYFMKLDTTEYNGYYFISPGTKSPMRYDLILQALYVKPGTGYSVSNTEQTHSHLMALKTFRLANINYSEVAAESDSAGTGLLNCNIQLTMLTQQSFKVELEGTNFAGNLGGALNFIYQHKNLFRGAELFNLKLKGAYEALSQYTKIRSSQEYAVETSLRIPKFLLPFLEKETFIKKFNPTTNLLAAFNYQTMPYYTRTMANTTFGYNWSAGNYSSHIVNPLQFNLVNILSIDSAFQKDIERSSLAYSYRDVLILGGNYSYTFNNQSIKKSKDYWYLRMNAETAGNMLGLAGGLAGWEKTDSSYHFMGQSFAQYIRADIDLRYNILFNDVSSIVYRAFAGVGIPYGNSRAIPFEKQYFGGGANGIRAWQVRTLGPGTYKPDSTTYLNQTADIKLEFNAEYRFKLFWVLEGAVFLDAGNIWSYNKDETRPGSQFNIKTFYKDIAVGTGTGFRFDFSFVKLRADVGLKLRDPWISEGSRWIPLSRPYQRSDFTIVLGIGYPF